MMHDAKEGDSMSRKDFLKQLIRTHKRRLQILKGQFQKPPEQPQVEPHILVEIEDLEVLIQQLQKDLEDESVKNKDELRGVLMATRRRLHRLKEVQVRVALQSHTQEIMEIEAEIRRLQAELENLD
jgi:hypothetical protein